MRVSGSERILGVLGYLPLLFVVAIKVKRDSMFVQFHGRQSGVLFVVWLILMVLIFALVAFLPSGDVNDPKNIMPTVQTAVLGVGALFTILYALLALTGVFKVLLGERYRMPVIADIALMLRL